MGNERDSHFMNMILILLVGAIVVAALVSGFLVIWPYLLYFILPFFIASFVLALILKLIVCGVGENSPADYKRLSFAYPALILVFTLVFYGASEKALPVAKKGQFDLSKLDWPEAFVSFNVTRTDAYKSSYFKSVQGEASRLKMYDRFEIGWIAALSLILGSPIFFILLMSGQKSKDAADRAVEVDQLLSKEKEKIRVKELNLEAEVQKRTLTAERRAMEARAEVAKVQKENEELRARAEFAPLKAKTSGTQKSGVLDKGIF